MHFSQTLLIAAAAAVAVAKALEWAGHGEHGVKGFAGHEGRVHARDALKGHEHNDPAYLAAHTGEHGHYARDAEADAKEGVRKHDDPAYREAHAGEHGHYARDAAYYRPSRPEAEQDEHRPSHWVRDAAYRRPARPTDEEGEHGHMTRDAFVPSNGDPKVPAWEYKEEGDKDGFIDFEHIHARNEHAHEGSAEHHGEHTGGHARPHHARDAEAEQKGWTGQGSAQQGGHHNYHERDAHEGGEHHGAPDETGSKKSGWMSW